MTVRVRDEGCGSAQLLRLEDGHQVYQQHPVDHKLLSQVGNIALTDDDDPK